MALHPINPLHLGDRSKAWAPSTEEAVLVSDRSGQQESARPWWLLLMVDTSRCYSKVSSSPILYCQWAKEVLISSPSTKQLPWCAVIPPVWVYCALLELNFLFLPFSEMHIQ